MHIVPGSPRGCVAYAGVALALGARFTTCASLCRSRSGACPTWVRGGNRGFARPLGSLHRLPTLCRPFHGLIPRVMLVCRGFARPGGSLHRLPTLCHPFHGLIPRVMLGCRGFARPLGSLHRLPTLCRPFHGLIPRVMLGCRGCAPPVGLAPPPAYSMSPVSRAKIEFMPVVARRRGYIEIFFSCDLLLILLHRLVAGVAVARKTGDIE